MKGPLPLFDAYADVTINRHGGNTQSNQANVKAAPMKLNWRERVLALMAVRDAAGKGTTLRDACEALGKQKNELSSTFTALKTEHEPYIEPTNTTIDGFMVYRLTGSKRVHLEAK